MRVSHQRREAQIVIPPTLRYQVNAMEGLTVWFLQLSMEIATGRSEHGNGDEEPMQAERVTIANVARWRLTRYDSI